jgi:hypothetical protein
VRQGLASKLVLRAQGTPPPGGGVQGSPEYGAEWFDVERTLTLYDEVYQWRGLRDRDLWPDRSTLNVPYYFYALALQLADVGRAAGLPAERIEALDADADAFLVLAAGGISGAPEVEEVAAGGG